MTLKLSNAKIRDLLAAHNQLDGWQDVIRENGQKIVVRQPYILSGKAIYNITKNIRLLREFVEKVNKDRDEILSRISLGTNEIDGEKEPEKAREFAKAVGEIEEDVIEVSGLLGLKMTELLNDDLEGNEKRDKNRVTNPIPSTALASLAPVLDIFQGPAIE